MRPTSLLPARIAQYIHVAETGCWLWQAQVDGKGYGRATYKKRWFLAHRLMWELLVGPIPPGMTIDHQCHDNNCGQTNRDCLHRRCVNPSHLTVMTPGDNSSRPRREKTTCRRGHEYDSEERRSDGRVARRCTRCDRQQAIERAAKPVECPSCGKTFRRDSLRWHEERWHRPVTSLAAKENAAP